MPMVFLSQTSGFQKRNPARSASGFATNIVSASQNRYKCVLRLSTRNASSKSSANRAFGNTANQSLLDPLLCLRRVVVPMARCFSSDS